MQIDLQASISINQCYLNLNTSYIIDTMHTKCIRAIVCPPSHVKMRRLWSCSCFLHGKKKEIKVYINFPLVHRFPVQVLENLLLELTFWS